MNANKTKDYISSIIGNPKLSESIYSALETIIKCKDIYFESKSSVVETFDLILNNSIRDIENHPRGILFQRCIYMVH